MGDNHHRFTIPTAALLARRRIRCLHRAATFLALEVNRHGAGSERGNDWFLEYKPSWGSVSAVAAAWRVNHAIGIRYPATGVHYQ